MSYLTFHTPLLKILWYKFLNQLTFIKKSICLTLCLQCWNSTISVTASTHHNTYILFLVTVPSHYFYALERKLFGHVSLIVDSPRKYRMLVKVKCWQMVFCYQNCSDQLWEKNVLVIQKNFWNSRLKAENLQKFWDPYHIFFKQWNVRTIFGNRMFF